MLAGVSGVGPLPEAGRDAFGSAPGTRSDSATGGLCALCARASRTCPSRTAECQHQIGLAVLEQVGGLPRPVVRIDRHAADADAVQRQLVQDVLGAILEQRRHAMAQAIARAGVGCRQLLDARARLRVRHLEARGQVAALVVGRDGQERPVGMGRYRCRKDSADGGVVPYLRHISLPLSWRDP